MVTSITSPKPQLTFHWVSLCITVSKSSQSLDTPKSPPWNAPS